MFCKWCGNNLRLTDKKCSACGRETPPMSDCGGFYNLKHSNGGTGVTPVASTEKVIVKEVPNCSAVEKMEAKYAKERKAARKHHTMTMLCFGIVLIAIICTAVLAVIANSQLGKLKEYIGNIQIEIPTNATECTVNEPIENQLDDESEEHTPYSFELDVAVINADNSAISTAFNFGSYENSVKVTTVPKESGEEQGIDISFVLAENESVDLKLRYFGEETAPLSIGVKGSSSLPIFENQDVTYEWQYRSSIGKWSSAGSDITSVNDEEYSCITCEEEWLKKVTIMKQPIELQCIINIENNSGDSMQITLGGIRITADGMIVNDNQ